MRFVVDENVSLEVVSRQRQASHEVEYRVEAMERGIDDPEVFDLAVQRNAILVTRDHHLTNHLRFPSHRCSGILYIRHGNLTSDQEAEIVLGFVQSHPLDAYVGHLVTLYREGFRIR